MMGMYCCCHQRIGQDGEWECLCEWDGWISNCDYPRERKNKHLPISNPPKDGIYLVRRQTGSADRFEEETEFFFTPKTVACGYTATLHQIHWGGDSDHQPYAWKYLDDLALPQTEHP
jgi:hypothetical protein